MALGFEPGANVYNVMIPNSLSGGLSVGCEAREQHYGSRKDKGNKDLFLHVF